MSAAIPTQRRRGAGSDTWPCVRLGEVCVSLTSQIRQRDLDGNTGPYPIFGAAGFLRNSCFCMVDKPAIAMVKDGAGVGRVMCIPANSAVIGTMLILKPNNGIDRGYLFYALSSLNLGRLCSGATIPHLYFRDMKALTVPLPPLAIQRRIAAKLDRICDIVAKRKDQLSQLNQLVKSRFVEMFGDLVKNDKGWPLLPLGKVCDVRDGTHASPQYLMSGYPLMTSKNFTNGYEDFSDVKLISKEDFEEINRRSRVDVGDIVMPMIGTIGNPVIITTRREFAIKNVSLIKFVVGSPINVFVKAVLSSQYFQRVVDEKNRGNTQKFIALSDIRGFNIPLPPLALQREFAAFVEKVDKLAAAVKRGLEAAERLYRQQMQEFFGETATNTTKTTETTKTTKTANAGGFSLSGLSTPSQGLNSPVGHRAKGGNANG